MTRLTPASSILLAFFVTGCSLQPVYERPAAPIATAYPQGPAYKPVSGSTTSAAAPDIAWRDFLREPRLQQLVDIALHNNRDLRVSTLNVDKVRAQYQIQRAALSPQISATLNGSNARKPNTVNSDLPATYTHDYTSGISASWEIDFFGRLRSLSDAALQQYLASDYARQANEILLVSQVADQYLTLLAYDAQLAVTQGTLEASRASYKIMQLQFDTGTLSEIDLRSAQTSVEQAQYNYQAQIRSRAQAENALVLLIGQPLPANLAPASTLNDQHLLTDIPEGLPSDLLQRRPDILQAEATLQSQHASIGAARAAFFPRITLTGTAGSQSATLGGLFSAGSGAWSFLPSISLPIFSGGANRANLDVAEVQKNIGVAQYEKAIQTAFREVSDGLAARGTYDAQVAAQQRYTQAQQRRLELATLLYNNGSASYLNVLTAHVDFYNAQQTLITARLNRLTNLVDLYRALGGGWHTLARQTSQ